MPPNVVCRHQVQINHHIVNDRRHRLGWCYGDGDQQDEDEDDDGENEDTGRVDDDNNEDYHPHKFHKHSTPLQFMIIHTNEFIVQRHGTIANINNHCEFNSHTHTSTSFTSTLICSIRIINRDYFASSFAIYLFLNEITI